MSSIQDKIKILAQKISQTESMIFTTHKMSDGDGLGSMLSFYHAFKKQKTVQTITVDQVPKKYHFLSPERYSQNFSQLKNPIQKSQICLVFDTNDSQCLHPLYTELTQKSKEIIYIDHHFISDPQARISPLSVIDTKAASTGELCYFLLKEMNINFTPEIATALYVSIISDTQRFQFIKNSPNSHKICADLCTYIQNNEYIYNQIFGIISLEKINFLSQTIQKIKYFYQNTLAILEIDKKDLNKNKLDIGDACDFLDMTLEINSIQYSILIIKLSNNQYKLSFRSKTKSILTIAEAFNGGGHRKSAGALLTNYDKNPTEEILKIFLHQKYFDV